MDGKDNTNSKKCFLFKLLTPVLTRIEVMQISEADPNLKANSMLQSIIIILALVLCKYLHYILKKNFSPLKNCKMLHKFLSAFLVLFVTFMLLFVATPIMGEPKPEPQILDTNLGLG